MASRPTAHAGNPKADEGPQPTDAVTEEVQEKVDEETKQGFRGTEVDGTPNENYAVQGVTSGAPTPETDPDQARKATEHLR